MIEAVNSVLQNAQVVRASNEQAVAAESFAANPERVQKAPVLAPYVSPYIYMDVNYNRAVLQLRDGDTGDVENQFPSQAALEAAARRAAVQQVAREAALQGQLPAQSATQATAAVAVNVTTSEVSSASRGPSAQQQAAFVAAARAGNSNAGSVTVFA